MARRSAGLLLYRRGADGIEVLLGHPGGPFWRRKDAGAWTIFKGEIPEGEEPLETARRELREETGLEPPDGPLLDLGEARLKSGKRVRAWAVAGDADPEALVSNRIELEWPPRSGQRIAVPEIDRHAFFDLDAAREKIHPGLVPLLDRLGEAIGGGRQKADADPRDR